MKPKIPYIISVLLITVLVLSVTGYSSNRKDDFPLSDLLSRDQGLVIIEQLSVREYRQMNTQNELNARKIVFSENSRRIDIENLRMILYENNLPQANMMGRIASFDLSTKTGEISHNVRYELAKGGILTCDRLIWNMQSDEIKVPGPFEITHNNQMIRASNLVTDRNLEKGSVENLEAVLK